MGDMFKIKCLDCNEYSIEIYEGGGFIGYFEIYYCPNCHKIENLSYDYNKKSPNKKQCKKCKTELVKCKIKSKRNDDLNRLEYKITPQIRCPKCHSKNIELINFGFWD